MSVPIALYPTPEQFQALLAAPDDGPVVMVNLLRFQPSGDGAGEDEYRLYAEKMVAFVES
ncbi:MAG: hypothetical protein ACRDJ1_05295 [Actinomycetota bacterium]